jgi:hypothetical protein
MEFGKHPNNVMHVKKQDYIGTYNVSISLQANEINITLVEQVVKS